MKIEKLLPAYKSIIWGGSKLKKYYGKNSDAEPLAESWELSLHKDGESTLVDGTPLSVAASESDFGENCKGFPFFPVLVKLIDANAKLSVQVHPEDEYALKNENSLGKTEMWYIADADEGAGIYLGFNKDIDRDEFKRAIEEKTLTDYLSFIPVKKGECYFIPAGTIHAICEGCLICEVQQNSNITYRVYDYGRVGADGKERELHVNKAIDVTNTQRYISQPMSAVTKEGKLLGISKFFTAALLNSTDISPLDNDEKSFRCITCLEGEGSIGDLHISKGESVFVPASSGKVDLGGDFSGIVTSIRKYYIGIDLGGTFIKGGIVNDRGEVIISDKVPTESEKGAEGVSHNIAALATKLLGAVNLGISDVEGVGIGCPGMIDSAVGNVIYSNNLDWVDFNIAESVSKRLCGVKVVVANDANVAALGEVKFGAAKEYNSAVMITLGTGVGGGVIVDGRLIEGNKGAGAELGHMVIHRGGESCTCGRKGCFEAYCSATALIRETKRAMLEDRNSKMWEIGDPSSVDGKTAFSYAECDRSAALVVEKYIDDLACGLTNMANIFRPEVILLGGGVCAEGDRLIKPLQNKLNEEIFAGDKGPTVPILVAKLGNSAGLLGAAALLI
ncbi:MAG: ROK family protein [Clostridia bacterium]|nr:ROK family protein [Clostridia bacterium]